MTKKDVEERRSEAIDWFMRRNDISWSARDEANFQDWLARESDNSAAFEDIAGMFAHLSTMDFGTAPAAQSPRKLFRIAGLGAASAAALALLAFFDDLSVYLRADAFTGAGETRQMTLADGSRVHLDAQSALATHIEHHRRRVTLLRGQAWFEVASNPTSPFIVETAGGSITALGTAFDVSLERDVARVIVTQHSVSISSGGNEVIVKEGQQSAFAENAAARPPVAADLEQEMSWRRGRLVFENQPLGEVVRALSRYHRGKVVFLDPSLPSRRVTGVFGADDPVLALEEIKTALGLRMLEASRYLIFLY